MADDLLVRKAQTIERCVARARDEYFKEPSSFANDFTRQDAAILNIQRACEAALDMGQYFLLHERLGAPQAARDVFALLAAAGRVDQGLAERLMKMVGFRNIAVHDYQALALPIVVSIITERLDDLLAFSATLLGGAPRP